MRQHRSIRKYKSEPVPDDLLQDILESGMRASSSGNMQAYSIVISKSAQMRADLHKLHFHQDMVLEAPLFLTFCSDFYRMRRWLELSQAPSNFDNLMSFMIGAIDAILVCQNIALAAEAHGLGICYLGTTLANCDKISEFLELPENVVPVVGIVMGYPAEDPPLRDRLPLDGLVHRERYHRYSCEEIKAIYKMREQTGWERYLSSAKLASTVHETGVENLAQIYTTIKYTRASHVQYSEQVLTCLTRQKFLNHDG